MKKIILLALLVISLLLPHSAMAMEATMPHDEYIEAESINKYTKQDNSDIAALATVSVVFVSVIIGFGIVEYKGRRKGKS